MIKIFASLIIAITAFGFMQQGETITVKGSDTMVILAQRWAEMYMSKNPGTTVQVTGGGSRTGISALINGTTDICNSSRPMKKTEKQKLKQRYNTLGVEIKAAKDGLAIYVHETLPISELTLAQIKAIYTSRITNWKDVLALERKISTQDFLLSYLLDCKREKANFYLQIRLHFFPRPENARLFSEFLKSAA